MRGGWPIWRASPPLAIIARRALLLRLSALPEDLARPHHRRLAHEALLPLIDADRARLFRLPNADMVVVWRGMAEAALQTCLATLRYLFADEPGQPPDALILLLDLPGDATRLANEAEASLHPRRTAPIRPPPRRTPLDPATLAALQAALARASIDRFLRRQRICEAGPDGFLPRWERRTVSIDEIGETMVPHRDLRADPWLLRCLTRTLDQRLLSLLAAPGELRGAAPFSLDLNVASLLGPDFLRFDAALPSSLRGTIMVALRPARHTGRPRRLSVRARFRPRARLSARAGRHRRGAAGAVPARRPRPRSAAAPLVAGTRG